MSHTTEISKIVFTDIPALHAAVAELAKSGIDCRLEAGTTPRAYYATQAGMGKADHVLVLGKSRYDVGFYPNAEGNGYIARTDLYGGDVARQIGVPLRAGVEPTQAALGKLYQMYAVHATTSRAVKQGHRVQRLNKPDGTIQLVVNS